MDNLLQKKTIIDLNCDIIQINMAKTPKHIQRAKQLFLVLPISVLMVIGTAIVHVPQTQALGLTATVSVSSGCVGAVNGVANAPVNVVTGSNVSITVTNSDGVVSQTISGPGIPAGTEVNENSKTSNNVTIVNPGVVTSPITITFTPIPINYTDPVFVNNCPMSSTPVASTMVLNPIAAPVTQSTTSGSQIVTSTSTPTNTSTPVKTTTTPTTTSSNTSSVKSPSVQSHKQPVKANLKNTSDVTKVSLGIIALIIIAIAIASRLGYIPYRTAYQTIRREPKHKPTARKRSR